MFVFRFMSKEEFTKYINGEILINEKDHSIHSKTKSKGFCFMEYENNHSVENAFEYLDGIVSEDYVCIFECKESLLTSSYGVYADPFGCFFDTITVDEFCCNSYSNKDFKLKSYCEDVSWNYDKQKNIF